MYMLKLGARVRQRRRTMKLTQEQLAEQIGISASFLGHIERGSRVPSVDTLLELCRVLHATPNELLGMTLPPEPATDALHAEACEVLQYALDLLRSRS